MPDLRLWLKNRKKIENTVERAKDERKLIGKIEEKKNKVVRKEEHIIKKKTVIKNIHIKYCDKIYV